jgi:phage terminase Nu1 subunit (DNA packaging protein)
MGETTGNSGMEIVGVDVIAQDFGVTTRQVRNYHKKGLPMVAPGRYDREKALAWWEKFVEGNGNDTTLRDAEIRLKTAQAEIHELKLAAARGEYLPANLVKKVWERAITSFRARMLAIPRRAVSRLKGTTGGVQREKILSDMVHEALNELVAADYPGVIGGAIEDLDRGDSEPEAPAPTDDQPVGRRKPRPKPRKQLRAGKVGHKRR